MMRFGIATGLVFVLSTLSGAQATDLDEDGLPDDFEQMLIDRYAPVLKYDSSEIRFPCSAHWFITHSELWLPGANPSILISNLSLQQNPWQILNGQIPLSLIHAGVNPTAYQTEYRLRLLPNNHLGQIGLEWACGDASQWQCDDTTPCVPCCSYGMYAHVMPVDMPVHYIGWYHQPLDVGPGDVLVQYWQFLPDNCGCGFCGFAAPHQGDWLYLDVYVRRNGPHEAGQNGGVKYMVYHHHGDGNCHPDILPWQGAIFSDGVPICIVERGDHEWWPYGAHDCGFGPCDVDDDGAGVCYRAHNILNLGERFSAMPDDEAQFITYYAGQWGETPETPDGPATLSQAGPCYQVRFVPLMSPPHPPGSGYWVCDDDPQHAAFQRLPLHVAYVEVGAPGNAPLGLGSRFHPHAAFASAAAAVEDTVAMYRAEGFDVSGGIRLKAGTYPLGGGPVTLSQPMTIEIWEQGPATIGP